MGGNLAVIESLVGTDFDMLCPGAILFIEDVGDEVFRVERMMCHLLLTGVLPKLSGLVVGSFTRYRESEQGSAMHDMIRASPLGMPGAMCHWWRALTRNCVCRSNLPRSPLPGKKRYLVIL